jgi:hypothetical protein
MWSDASRSRGVDIEMLRRYRARQCNRPDWCWRSPGGHAAEDRITQECRDGAPASGVAAASQASRIAAAWRFVARCGPTVAPQGRQKWLVGSRGQVALASRQLPFAAHTRFSAGGGLLSGRRLPPGISSTPQPAPVASETLRVSRSYDDRLRTVTKAQGTIAAVRDAASIIMLIARLP